MKKRLIPVFLLLVFLTFGAFSEPVPSNVAITIDGVRTAFFDEAGNYLSPLEENGIVYVPVLQLAESLGLDVTVDVEKLAVTLNGVRTAFFAEGGAYLPPLNVNGILYAPLDAFIESAGIAVEKEDGKYGFARTQESSLQTEVPSTPKISLVEILTSEPWLEAFAPDDKVTFNNDGTALNEFTSDGEPFSVKYKWEATGDTTFNLFVYAYEISEQNGVTVFTSISDRSKFFVRESEYEKATRVISTPAPSPTPVPIRNIQLGETIEKDYINISVDDVRLYNRLYYVSNNRLQSKSCTDGKMYFSITGTIENTGANELNLYYLKTQMVFDGKYTYTGHAYYSDNSFLSSRIMP